MFDPCLLTVLLEVAPGGVYCTNSAQSGSAPRPGAPKDEGCPGACLRSLWVSENKDVGEAPRNSAWGLRAPCFWMSFKGNT